MAPFFFHYISLHRSQITGLGVRAMKARLERKPRVNMRVRQSLRAMEIAAAETVAQNSRIRVENFLLFLADALTDLWVSDCLVEAKTTL